MYIYDVQKMLTSATTQNYIEEKKESLNQYTSNSYSRLFNSAAFKNARSRSYKI